MSHFYAEVTGSRDSTVSKTGTKQSGISAHIRGWNIGVKVNLIHTSEGEDKIILTRTAGSNNSVSIGNSIIWKESEAV